MFKQGDLRGIVTLVMLGIFGLAVFMPPLIQLFSGQVIPLTESFAQAVIQLTTAVVMFYFGNKATQDKM